MWPTQILQRQSRVVPSAAQVVLVANKEVVTVHVWERECEVVVALSNHPRPTAYLKQGSSLGSQDYTVTTIRLVVETSLTNAITIITV